MALVGDKVFTKLIPHEPGCALEYRQLTGKILERAQRKAQLAALELARGLDPAMFTNRDDKAEPAEKVEKTTFTSSDYDIDMVLKGVVRITGEGYPEKWGDKHCEKLDSATREFAFQTILEESVVPSS